MSLKKGLYLSLVILVSLLPSVARAQSYIEVFGQNRIQYRKFQWKYFDTKHFRVYHYDKAGRQLGRYVAEEAENNIPTIEKKLGGEFPKRFNIVLYNSYDEYRQSNIGLKDESQATSNTVAGTLNLVGDKLVVYFTGEHSDLKHQIRAGMARIVMDRMLFGENFKKMVKSALALNLPQWVTDGYISYIVDGWDARSNSEWKSRLDARPDAGFYALSEQYPEIAGKAFWKFVFDEYGTGTAKSLLYNMQQKTSLNKAMKEPENLYMKITKAYDSCIKYYKKIYALDARSQENPDSTKGLIALKVPKDNTVIRNIRVSPRGSDIVYVAWKDGRYTIYDQRTTNDKEASVLLEGGQKDLTEQIDPSYPMLAWSNTGYKLAILYKQGHKTMLRIYNSMYGRISDIQIKDKKFDRVLSMCFDQDDDKLVFSAIKKSQTDLYLFTIKGAKMTNITDDVWDDVDPVFVSGGSRKGILFLSNRPKPQMDVPLGVNELPTGPMNVFFYNTTTMRPELLQCTHYTTGHVTQPIQYGFDNFAYLYDGNGINNKYVVLFARDAHNKDSAYSVPITNYNSSIISQQYNQASGDVADIIQKKDKYVAYFHPLQMPGVNTQVKTLQPTILSVERPEPQTTTGIVLDKHTHHYRQEEFQKKTPDIVGGNTFQSEFTDTAATQPKKKKPKEDNDIFNTSKGNGADSTLLSVISDSAYVKMKPANYRLSFKPDFLSIKLDNSILFSQYQSIATNGGQYETPSLSALATLSLNELMEDHRITFGFQLPIDASGSTYFMQYQNFVHRLDWGLLALRSQDKESLPVGYIDPSGNIYVQNQDFKTVSNMLQGSLSYPLDRVRSIRFQTAIKQDKLVEKASDTLSLSYNLSSTEYTSLSRLEYVFDNTISPVQNIMFGTRFKFYGEYLYGLNAGNRSCYNLGADIRNYQKIYKNFILASRFAYAHSDGNYEVEYLLGGVDNWLNTTQAPASGASSNNTYGFQDMVTSMRGYDQGAFTGNNYAVLSTEFRLPILTTFMNRPIQSSILKNLQFVAFCDIGATWDGFLPNSVISNNNYSYPTQFSQPSPTNNVYLYVTVPGNSSIGVGYGPGLRTSLFGYFVRMDAAWNSDGIKKPIIYFALGTDF